MSTPWNSLYCPSEDTEAIVHSLRESMLASGYQAYDPFGAFPGKSYTRTVRLFVAPPQAGWTHIIGESDAEQIAALSQLTTCLYVQLNGWQPTITVYTDGRPTSHLDGLNAFLREGRSPSDLKAVLDDAIGPGETTGRAGTSVFDVLPDDVGGLAAQVDKRSAEQMFNRLSGQLMKKVGGRAEAAQALVNNSNVPDWNSSGGEQIWRLMNCLTIPEDWREPDFDTLRDAYTLHVRRQRNPNAHLYPGDKEIMAGVTNALDYIPVYGGRNP